MTCVSELEDSVSILTVANATRLRGFAVQVNMILVEKICQRLNGDLPE
jgi:hypothetical protein